MTIENTKRLIRHQGNGATTAFPYDFLIPTADDVVVLLYDDDTQVSQEIDAADYSVDGLGEDAGGEVTYPLVGDPLDSTQWLVIKRAVPYIQEANINSQGGFFPNIIEDQLDLLAMQTQQLAEEHTRTPMLLEGDVFTKPLPRKTALFDRVMAFDAQGEPTIGPTATEVSTAQASAQAAAASAVVASDAADTAEQARDEFVGRYLGAHVDDAAALAANPNPEEGAAYFNTTSNVWRIWNGTLFIAPSSGFGDSGTFTGDGATTNFDIGYIIPAFSVLWVEDNEILTPGTDYTMSGSEVVRTGAPVNNADILWILLPGTGPQGPQGDQGVAGDPGSVWHHGTTAPSSGTGVVGDFYLDSVAGDYYTKTGAATWTLIGNLKPTGTVDSGTFVGDGVETRFNIGHNVLNAQVIWVEDGVIQEPGVAFNMSGLEVVRTTPPVSGAAIFWMLLSGVGPAGADGVQGAPGADGLDGADAYVYIAYASASDGTDFTLTFDPALDYIAILATDTEIVAPAVGDFVGLWKQYRGPPGSDGADGTDPGFLYNFDTGTADADPGPGVIRANNADLSLATELYIDKEDRNGNVHGPALLTWDDSTNTIKGHLYLTLVPTAAVVFEITGVTDATGYVKVAVTYVSGATAFNDTDPLSVQFSRAGDKGADGAGTGDVVGPANAVDSAIALFDGTTGELLKDSAKTIVTALGIDDTTVPTSKAVKDVTDTKAADADLTAHEADVANPHSVTQTQVGLGNVDNTADADKPVSTAQQAALDLKEDLGETLINTQTSSYTLALSDKGKTVEMNVAGANNLTVPPNSSVAFPIGSRLNVVQLGAGQTTVVEGAGVTVRSEGGLLLGGQYAGAALYKRGTDEWVMVGNLTT